MVYRNQSLPFDKASRCLPCAFTLGGIFRLDAENAMGSIALREKPMLREHRIIEEPFTWNGEIQAT